MCVEKEGENPPCTLSNLSPDLYFKNQSLKCPNFGQGPVIEEFLEAQRGALRHLWPVVEILYSSVGKTCFVLTKLSFKNS